MTRRPVAYIRKSKKLEESAAAQLAAVRELMARDGHNGDSVVYNDAGRSGDRAKLGKRTAWTEMNAAIERGEVSTVYVRVLDRTGRSLEEWLRFLRICQEHGVRIVDQTGDRSDPANEDSALFEMWAAQKELKRAKERSNWTLRMQRARGDAIGHAPYGFTLEREPGTRRIIRIPNPEEPLEPLFKAVRETRGNILAACKLLNARGVPSRFGTPWSTRTLHRAIKENQPSLLRRAPATMTKSGLRPPAPLARLVICHCGGTMTPHPSTKDLTCAAGHKVGVAIHGRYVARERHVYDLLRAELAVAAAAFINFDRPDGGADLAARRAELEDQLRRLGKAYVARALDDDEFEAGRVKVQREIDELLDVDEDELVTWTGIAPLVDWNAEPEALGDQLRRVFREVRLDENMMPVEAVWRHPSWRMTPEEIADDKAHPERRMTDQELFERGMLDRVGP